MELQQTAIAPLHTPFKGEWKLRRWATREIHGYNWHYVYETLLTEAFRDADITPEEVFTELTRGEMQLWLIFRLGMPADGAVLTQLVDTPRGKACLIVSCGGKGMSNWLHLLVEIEGWAKDLGCNEMRLSGRKGWKRALHDYRETGVILTKEL